MLNELLQATNAIPNLPDTLHKSLKTLPKYPSYKVSLDANGAIVDVVPWDTITGLRKWQPGGNGFSTPVFSVPPLFPIFDPALDRQAAEKTTKQAKAEWEAASKADAATWTAYFATVQERRNQCAGSWLSAKTNTIDEKFRKSLGDVPAQLLALLPANDTDYAVLRVLLERLERLTPERFFPEIERQLVAQLGNAYDEKLFRLYCAFSAAEAGKPCNLLLDVSDWDAIGDYPVTHARTTALVNALLTSANASVATTATVSPDAYGRAAIDAEDKFADLIVPGLGKVILRAMTKDVPCQYRYGKADADSFLVGAESRARAKSALEFLVQGERKGKTWQYRGGSLFLFYPEEELALLTDVDVADICTFPDDEDDDSYAEAASKEATFEARAERIAIALDGKDRESDIPVHLIVLRKPDGHRTKLVAHHTFTMRGLRAAAQSWTAGARSCPPIAFARWGKAKGQRNDIVPETPYPYQVTNWLNTFWVRGDENQGKFKTFSPEDALTLLLTTDGTQAQMARRALRHALAGWSGFLIAAGAREHESTVLKGADKRAAALSSLPAILALLLFKSEPDISREHIMASPAFLLGRLLALADSLHYEYCVAVRDGQVPRQLLGNALMATALETPEAALAMYGQRILPYQAWARTCKVGEKDPKALAKTRAKYFLARLGDACSEICMLDLPKPASDHDKAQMILGYLAKPAAKDEAPSTEPNPTEPKEEN